MIIDAFIDDFDALNAHARSLEYAGAVNPGDGIRYPDVSIDVPAETMAEVQVKAEQHLQHSLATNLIFFRLTNRLTTGEPHQAHNDTIMGDYTFLLYMQDGEGGTGMVRHKKTGMAADPRTPREQECWEADTNNPEAWETYDMVEMRANRACIIPSYRMHCAFPIGGFGDGVGDGRIVLTAFFDG